jgi:phenylacetic acid degradation operon negative regulatory protein
VSRHLRIDPYLPPELLPPNWPGQELRERYIRVRDDFAQRLRDYSTA